MKLCAEPRARVVLFFPRLQEGQYPVWAPQDLFSIATTLMHRGYEVSLIDDRAGPEAREELLRELPGALFVGLGTKLGEQLRNTLSAIESIKAARPDVPVVVGGWFPSLFPEALFDSPHVDAIVIGPGDFAAPELADRLLERQSLAGLQGVWAREGGRILRNSFGHLPDITLTPPIPYDVVGIARYMHPHGWINTFTSRGCPGECNFCSIYCLDPKRWTAHKPERVVDDLARLVALGFRAFKVMDTDFCANVKRVEEICQGILARRLDIRFEVLGRHWNLRTMSAEQVRLLRRAGCTEIEMGVESGSQRLSDLVRKKLDVTEVPATVRRFVQGGIRMKLNFMFGIPSETSEDLTATLRLIDRVLVENGDDGVRLQLFRYTPLPGAAAKDDVWKPKVGEQERMSLAELAAYPVVEDDPGPMPWISPAHERVVKHVYYFYSPVAFLPSAIEPARLEGRWLWYRWLRLLRPLARWRLRNGVYALPFERWLNERFGHPFRHGSDDGITDPSDTLPVPVMGENFDTRAPLQPAAGL
jgi:radical SAM superfamily enzyme YgiQ (UPF0313 family)